MSVWTLCRCKLENHNLWARPVERSREEWHTYMTWGWWTWDRDTTYRVENLVIPTSGWRLVKYPDDRPNIWLSQLNIWGSDRFPSYLRQRLCVDKWPDFDNLDRDYFYSSPFMMTISCKHRRTICTAFYYRDRVTVRRNELELSFSWTDIDGQDK